MDIVLDSIDREVADILTRYADREQRSAESRGERRIARRIEVRGMLRAGDLPGHFMGCAVCAKSLLELDHDAACPIGKQFPYIVLPQSQDQN